LRLTILFTGQRVNGPAQPRIH